MILKNLKIEKKNHPTGIFSCISIWGIAQKRLILMETGHILHFWPNEPIMIWVWRSCITNLHMRGFFLNLSDWFGKWFSILLLLANWHVHVV